MFLFLGPTGVGKTELAKALAEHLFADEKRLLRFDMSEYTDRWSADRLIGSPPGYLGHDDGGQLVNAIRERPYSVVLFDEIDKAHPRVLDVMLQIFDDGRLTDGRGQTADFTNALVILTSNKSTSASRTSIGFGRGRERAPSRSDDEEEMRRELAKELRPELLGRITRVVEFRRLGEDDACMIVDKIVRAVEKRLEKRRIRLVLDARARKVLVALGFDSAFGARRLERIIDERVVEPLARALLCKQRGAPLLPMGTIVRIVPTASKDDVRLVLPPAIVTVNAASRTRPAAAATAAVAKG